MLYNNNAMNKAFASDIDGTLFFPKLIPPVKESDLEAIKKYQSSNFLFGLCSGRPYCGVVNGFDDQIKPDFYIISSGALILDKNKQVIYERKIIFKYIQEIYEEYCNQAIVIVQTANPNGVYKSQKEFENEHNVIIIKDIKQLKDEKIYGISLVFKDDQTAYEKNCLINKKYSQLIGFQNTNSIDIVMKECSKGNALKIIQKEYQILKMAGIGDSYNDLSMLENVDVSFTFNDAPQELKDKTDYRVNSVSEALKIFALVE